MANFEIPEILEYIDRIRKLEPTDPAHADLFNAMFQALINNGAFLKKMQEKKRSRPSSNMSSSQATQT